MLSNNANKWGKPNAANHSNLPNFSIDGSKEINHPECLTAENRRKNFISTQYTAAHGAHLHSDDASGTRDSIARRATPAVSQRWSDLPGKARHELTEAEALLLQSVRAEDIFFHGQGERGGHDVLKASLNPFLKAF